MNKIHSKIPRDEFPVLTKNTVQHSVNQLCKRVRLNKKCWRLNSHRVIKHTLVLLRVLTMDRVIVALRMSCIINPLASNEHCRDWDKNQDRVKINSLTRFNTSAIGVCKWYISSSFISLMRVRCKTAYSTKSA